MLSSPTLICLMGPTAAGKTQLAVDLVQQFPFEIISVDSAMVYRNMDIGTAKPTDAILQLAPHRLINIRDPSDAYSAAQFREDALEQIADIIANKKIPLLVGGTMLYFHALQKGLAAMPAADVTIRQQIEIEARQWGWLALHEQLKKIDPEAAARIHPHDSQRIQRALEVYKLTGKNLTTWQAAQTSSLTDFQIHNLIVAPIDRSILHQRIEQRFKQMLAMGLIEEVNALFLRGDLNLDTPAMRSVGYRQVWDYLEGNYSLTDMSDKAIIATRQLAKRQLTWLRSWQGATWFNSEDPHLFDQVSLYLFNNEIYSFKRK